MNSMKLFELRKKLKTTASQHGIDSADVDFIISEVLEVKRTELNLIGEINDDKVAKIEKFFSERLTGKPVDKIFGKAYFYGMEFVVDCNVLTPRPESEILVDKALMAIKENSYKTVLDMCTGSGCLAIAIKKNADVDMTASDVSAKALKIAKQNAKNLDADVNFIRSDMFENIEGKYDLFVSNPPYIESDEIEFLDDEVKNHDPILALDGGDLGLKFYNIIHDNLRKTLNDGGMAIFEIGENQKDMIISLFTDFKFVECIKDYDGHDRVIVLKK